MSKLKVLAIKSDFTGVGAFRTVWPHIALENNYPDEFHVDIEYQPNFNDDNWLKQYDVIHYHRTIGPYEQMEALNKKLMDFGIVSIMDIDDYWAPGTHHPAYHLIKNAELDKKIIENIRLAQYVTTTTSIFAKEISKINKNVFVLPNAIDPTEKQFTPNPEPSNGRLRIAFLGGSCYDDTTEVLTENGFKLFKNLNKHEKVATLNPETNKLEYHKPYGYIAEPFNGLLNCAKTKLTEYAVTPNHKMFVSKTKKLRNKKELKYELVPSETIHNETFRVKRNAKWDGVDQKSFVLPKMIFDTPINMQKIVDLFKENDTKLIESDNELLLEYEGVSGVAYYTNNTKKETVQLKKSVKNNYYISNETNNTTYLEDKYGSDRMLNMDKWLKFFGFWMVEGWTTKTDGLYQVGIAQTKDNDYLEIQFNLLKEMGFNPTYTKDGHQIRVFDKQLWSYLRQFGNSYEKFIPKNILKLCPRQLNIFLDWFIKGDGSISIAKEGYQKKNAWTSSKSLADNLQEIALKTGVAATITNRGKRTSHIKGRAIITQHDSYQIGFSLHPSIGKGNYYNSLITPEKQFTREYNGIVYCVEVENHVLFVRKNGKAFWCGNSHLRDLEILNGVVGKLRGDGLMDKVQFVLCGFDLRGTHTDIDMATKKETQRPITPKESVWYQYEKIFTDDYKSVSPEYKDFLLKFKQEEYPNVANESYRRVWTKPISTYASNYNLFDISLAPLEENIFNGVKSQLKVVEAGFHHKALIAQDFGSYQIDLKNVIKFGGELDPNGNAILVETVKNHKDWYSAIKKLINNPELVKQLQDNLYNTVKNKYSINKVTEDRKNLYHKLVADMKETKNNNVLVTT